MQVDTYFGDLLKEILNFIGMKSSYLAKCLGYDVSYISKWCSGSKIPSSKNVEEIINDLSDIFYNEIIKKNCLEKFNERFLGKHSLLDIKDGISYILTEAYNKSKVKNEQGINIEDNNIIIGHVEIVDFIVNKLKEIVSNATEDLEILCTLDMLKILSNVYVEKFEFYNNGIKIDVKVGCSSLGFINDNSTYMKSLNMLLSKVGNCNFSFYDNSNFSNLNVLVIKDKLLMIFSLAKEDEICFASYTGRKEIINIIYRQVIGNFTKKNSIIEPIYIKGIQDDDYIINFYNSTKFHFYYSSGIDFLLPKDIIKKHIQCKKEYIKEYGILFDMDLVKFKESSLKIFVVKSKILHYIYTGQLKSKGILLKLNLDEVEVHLRNILNYISNNDKIKIFLIDDNYNNDDIDLINLNFYYNSDKAFFTKNTYNSNDSVFIYKLVDAYIIKSLDNYYKEIIKKNYCYNCSKKEFEHMINYHINIRRLTENID